MFTFLLSYTSNRSFKLTSCVKQLPFRVLFYVPLHSTYFYHGSFSHRFRFSNDVIQKTYTRQTQIGAASPKTTMPTNVGGSASPQDDLQAQLVPR